MIIQELISYANEKIKGTDKELEAIKFMVSERLNMSTSSLYINYLQKLDSRTIKCLKRDIHKYVKKNIPVQYILGYTYFYGLKIDVNPRVLIPRFETEELVEKTLENIALDERISILDVGTGSGAIALAVKKNRPLCRVVASDVSKSALKIAKQNAVNLKLDVDFKQSNLLDWAISENLVFDVIVSNPPYIDIAEPADYIVHKNEPHVALYAADEGLYFYKEIIRKSSLVLSQKGMIIFEIPYHKADEIKEYARKYLSNKKVFVLQDLQHKDRIVIIK